MEILHARSICETNQDPAEMMGESVTTRSRSVVCNDCGRAGTVATPGNEEVIREEWAIRNGYTLTRVDGRWVVELNR
jgi:Fe2+ or Zn2+ uptake regulation protein